MPSSFLGWPDIPGKSPRGISFFYEEVDFDLPQVRAVKSWILATVRQYACQLTYLQVIFCSDHFLYDLNVRYLGHNTLTDVITFPYTEPPAIEGDLFISIERVRENAASLSVPFEKEILRVIIHGVLHLCGTGDKTPEESLAMRAREEEALLLFFSGGFSR